LNYEKFILILHYFTWFDESSFSGSQRDENLVKSATCQFRRNYLFCYPSLMLIIHQNFVKTFVVGLKNVDILENNASLLGWA